MQKIMIGIYKITNPVGQIYIGQSKNIPQRFVTHKSIGNNLDIKDTKLQKSFNIYNVANHKFDIQEICLVDKLNERENYWQEYYNSIKNGLNSILTDGNKEYKSSGVTPKFPNVETTKLRIDRVVPKLKHDSIKQKVNELINQLQEECKK